MVRAALNKQVIHFSITEHISQFRKPRETIVFHSFHAKGRMFENFGEYKAEFEKIKPGSLRLKSGLEVDYIPKYEKQLAEQVNQEKWDILLCSVHELSDGKDVESRKKDQDRETSAKRWREYIDTQLHALESDLVSFNVLTHPIRLYAGTPDFPLDVDEMFLELATVARRGGKALELNGKDIELNRDLVERLAISCGKVGCQVSLGSDAHSPKTVRHNLDKATEMVKRLNLRVRL